MRQVRIVGLCLVAAFAISAIAAVPALAAKTKYTPNTWSQFKYCPYEEEKIEACILGLTSGGTSGGFFQLGRVEVPLSKPVALQVGEHYNEGLGLEEVFAAANGGETLESPELSVRKGIKLITPEVQAQAKWPQELKESFAQAVANKETSMKVKIEIAGTSLYGKPGALSTENLLSRSGAAFELPLKTKVISPWLAKLGGGTCTVGNEEHPIMQDLTTAGAGAVGELIFNEEFTQIVIKNSRLVDFNWPVEEASGASGCGGLTYEPYIDKAIDIVTEIPNADGFTVLQGTLYTGSATEVRVAAEKGEL